MHLLDVIGQVRQDQLQIMWLYSGDLYEEATIQALSNCYLDAIRSLISHCRTEEAGGFTPSDFPKARVTQKSLDRLLSGIGKK